MKALVLICDWSRVRCEDVEIVPRTTRSGTDDSKYGLHAGVIGTDISRVRRRPLSCKPAVS